MLIDGKLLRQTRVVVIDIALATVTTSFAEKVPSDRPVARVIKTTVVNKGFRRQN